MLAAISSALIKHPSIDETFLSSWNIRCTSPGARSATKGKQLSALFPHSVFRMMKNTLQKVIKQTED
ncbi:MAG: hypothetical protein GTO08_11970 [Deltaproteobacteria bacterium]|nr:hypothetical protein [Deltaproteobacteria bacterium]